MEEEGRPASDGDISKLPESCVAHALSLTTPRDACSSALVSATFRRAADSDTVWGRFLPPDHRELLSRAVVGPPAFSSKKELYFRLCCDPVLIDGGHMSLELERQSGKKCFMISARGLSIAWGDTDRYWSWITSADSRFTEIAELRAVCWLDICGRIDLRLLSPKTTYCARLVFKIAQRSGGLGFPCEASVTVGPHVSERRVFLRLGQSITYARQVEGTVAVPFSRGRRLVDGGDEGGWLNVELGEFFVEEGNEGEAEIRLYETKALHWKEGLIVLGIEVRPKM